MPLWEIPSDSSNTTQKKQVKETPKFKLNKGETLDTLIIAARKLVEEKLGKYKDTSKCVTEEQDLIRFFNETPENGIIALDTETTRLIFRLSINNVNQFIIGCANYILVGANGPELVIVYG